jgi:CheY-like chemotaxis protein
MAVRKVLHIDDDDDDQEIFSTALSKVDNTIALTAISNAAVALKEISSKSIEPDMIFLDLNMPGMNGQEFLQLIKGNTSLQHIPVIVLSTTSHKPTIELVKELGATDFFTKPELFEDLVVMLKKALQL